VRPWRARAGASLLVVLLAWTLFAFGGVYPSTLIMPAVLCVVLAVWSRPWTCPGAAPIAMAALILAAIALQLIPLPPAVLRVVSASSLGVWQALSLDARADLWRPISIDPPSTVWALGISAGLAALFLSARAAFASGGIRTVVRGVAVMGLAVAALAIAQEATAHGLMYWRWAPLEEGAPPFGPFVNRNHFATWIVLAWPACLGYLAAHAAAHGGVPDGSRRRLVEIFDGRAILLSAALIVMTVALVLSFSRSGLAGLAAALAVLAAIGATGGTIPGARIPRSFRMWCAVLAIAALGAIVARVDLASLSSRVSAAPAAMVDRTVIWRDTLPLVRDFWLTGTGAGTYETAMLAYQRSAPGVRFNQAHDHYLQAAAEGGLLIGIPLLLALAWLVRASAAHLRGPSSGVFWLRAGAAAGLAGAAVQSVWETGLTVPANGALAVVLAAILVHVPTPRAER
jgi:O-antigen ligase